MKHNPGLQTTDELLAFVHQIAGYVEAELQLHGGLHTTHVLQWRHGKLVDMSFCDGSTWRTSLKRFKAQYPDGQWRLSFIGWDDTNTWRPKRKRMKFEIQTHKAMAAIREEVAKEESEETIEKLLKELHIRLQLGDQYL